MPDGEPVPAPSLTLPPKPADLDPRLKLFLLIAACFICQYLPASWLPVWLALLCIPFFPRKKRGRNFRFMLHGGLCFIAFWLAMTVGSDVLAGRGWRDSFLASLPLGGRLLALTLVGMAHVEYSSPLQTGRAAAWFLRPLGGWSWRPALAIALTAWFLPQTLRLTSDIREGMRARGLRLSWRRKIPLLAGTAIRILETKASELAVGLASRRADDERSWR